MEQVVESTKELGAKVWESFSYFMKKLGSLYQNYLEPSCFGL